MLSRAEQARGVRSPGPACGAAAAGLLVLCLLFPAWVHGAAACVVVKRQGDSRELRWGVAADATVEAVLQELKRRLRAAGFGRERGEDLFPQATAELSHGYAVTVRTRYRNARGRPRTSFGCGFSAESLQSAGDAALRNLQSYSWGWTPDKGYEVLEQKRF